MARLLIVEDKQEDRIILRNIVERAGYEVFSVSDGAQAFAAYVRDSIEIVIMDLQMPSHVDGLEFIEAFRGLFPGASIIALCGMGTDLLAKAKRMGAVVALSKPVDPDELVEALEQATLHSSAVSA